MKETINAAWKSFGLSQTQLGLVFSSYNVLLLNTFWAGRGRIKSDCAFNTTPELWLNLQRNYDLWEAAHKSDDWKLVEAIAG